MLVNKFLMLLILLAGAFLLVYKAHYASPALGEQDHKEIEIVTVASRGEAGKYDISDIALMASGEAWAVGYDGKHIQRVYHSKDCGDSWSSINILGNDYTLKGISFSDSQHGWAVGGQGLVVHTIDGGETWKMLRPPDKTDLQVVHFLNLKIGYIAGRNTQLDPLTDEVKGDIKIYRTIDGGETWQQCYMESIPLNVFQVFSYSETTAFAILGGNKLIKTDNQGNTWREILLPAKSIRSISFLSNKIGWLVGKRTFLQSKDGGDSWEQVQLPLEEFTNKEWEAIEFNSNGHGLAVGKQGLLAFTFDYGKSWKLQTPAIDDDLRAVRIQGSSAIVLGAKNLYCIKF
jgi:photosystem II stability/assembly factor-like uncharacterized protein